MNSLHEFASLSNHEITLCEVNGKVHSMNYETANITAFTNTTDRHPKIHLTREMIHPNKFMEDRRELFVPVHVPFLKQISEIYYEQGLTEALETMYASRTFACSQIAYSLLVIMEKFQRVKQLLKPNVGKTANALINQHSQTRNWMNASVRCLALHKNFTKIAVAAFDDTVRIYSATTNLIPTLKCKQQKNIIAMAWRPLSNSDLAVACERCIILWNVDPNSVVTRLSANYAIIVARVEHTPILSISWSPRGHALASVAGNDSKILIWDIELDRCSSLKRVGSSGYTLVKWAPNDEKLFTATTSHIFRVWDCKSWKPERWSVLTGHVQAACWSPCNTNLLFATSVEPIIYALSFAKRDKLFTNDIESTPNEAVPLYDVAKIEMNGLFVGGLIKAMEFSPKGRHLAVLFNESNYIAIFNVINEQKLILTPGFFIVGNTQEIPTNIEFDPSFEFGACLCIGWSSGRVQHFPIVYSLYGDASDNFNQHSFNQSHNYTYGMK